jgi:hypothetical protein
VSEYQYYDFRAIDRPLTKKEMGSLRSISTRAAITTTSFTNHYERGDLKANPSKLLELSLGQHSLQFCFLFSGVLRNHARTAAGQMRGGEVGEEQRLTVSTTPMNAGVGKRVFAQLTSCALRKHPACTSG